MGMGVLGTAALERLGALSFQRAGWSRTPKERVGVDCYAGEAQLEAFLARLDILVCLLPLTADTGGILNARTFRALPHGASLVNVGRGGHVVQTDLLEALDRSEEHTSELQSPDHLVCRLLLEKKKKISKRCTPPTKKKKNRF